MCSWAMPGRYFSPLFLVDVLLGVHFQYPLRVLAVKLHFTAVECRSVGGRPFTAAVAFAGVLTVKGEV